MKKKYLILAAAVLVLCLAAAGCGKKKEQIPETSLPAETEDTYEKTDVTMELAKDDGLRQFLRAFDTYTDGGPAGSMNYDYRDTIGMRRLMDCLFGQRCCADYSLYPILQPSLNGNVQSVPMGAFQWVALNIFHVQSSEIESYKNASPAFSGDAFSGTITLNINGVQWYYSDFTILEATFDGTYYYVRYRRNHDDPSVEGAKYQQQYYAVLAKENVEGSDYWTMYTHSAGAFNYVVADKNLIPDKEFNPEKEMIINTETPVTMRSGPSTDYEALTSYNPGITVSAVGTKGDWTYVHYYDHYGWIYSEFLSPVGG